MAANSRKLIFLAFLVLILGLLCLNQLSKGTAYRADIGIIAHHWTPVEISYFLIVLSGIMLVLIATMAAYVLPLLQKKGIVNFSFLNFAQIKGTRQHSYLLAIKILFSILSMAACLCLIYGFFIEPYELVIHKMEIATNKLTTNRIRIVQVSDLHCDEVTRLEQRIVRTIAELHPDLIIFSGDGLNTQAALSNFKSLMHGLSLVAPTYGVKGDWDLFKQDIFSGTGAHELTATPATPAKIEKNGESIWIAGAPIERVKKVPQLLALIPHGAFTVFAYHFPYPDVLPPNADVDLFLVGHTHGGQVVLPGIGALITRSKYGTRYVSGMYHVGKMSMYVNSGVGMEGHLPRVRFLCPPELAVFDIVPESAKH